LSVSPKGSCQLGLELAQTPASHEIRREINAMTVIEVRFELEKETKGALRYQELDEKGEAIEQALGKIGTLYMRKMHSSKALHSPKPCA